jgi:proteasome lid subunit RPN8/RPN11
MCNKETIIDLHTHPFLHCIFSNQDIDSYEKYRKYNPDAIMALMCEENRVSMYGY